MQETPSICREPAVAGTFYPSNKKELEDKLAYFFSNAKPPINKSIRALIAPHAGYVYSGQVAASAYNQLKSDAQYDNIFVITSSHRTWFDGAALYDIGNYKTPLGEIEVNRELCKKLIEANPLFKSNSVAHKDEHSLEVHLPFLQYKLKNPFKLVPIVLGTTSPESCKKIAETLKPYFNEKNLFVISTDFSHYPTYDVAVATDKATAAAVMENNPITFVAKLKDIEDKAGKSLSTAMCGWTSVLTLLYLTGNDPNYEYDLIQYQNSGDVEFKDKSRVVGYNAIAVSQKVAVKNNEDFELSISEKAALLKLARKTVADYLKDKTIATLDEKDFSENLRRKCGAFVTLHKHGKLRGCIGRFSADEPLYKVVQSMAIAAAFEDYRFTKVTAEELNDIEFEISVLSPMKKIKSADELILGKHGIYMKKGNNAGTFLPQVATETGWSKEEFLGHCARDKAQIGWDGWKTAELFVYTALVFSEKDIKVKP